MPRLLKGTGGRWNLKKGGGRTVNGRERGRKNHVQIGRNHGMGQDENDNERKMKANQCGLMQRAPDQ